MEWRDSQEQRGHEAHPGPGESPPDPVHDRDGRHSGESREPPSHQDEVRGIHRSRGEDLLHGAPGQDRYTGPCGHDGTDEIEEEARVVEEVRVQVTGEQADGSSHDLNLVGTRIDMRYAEPDAPYAEEEGESENGGKSPGVEAPLD